MWWHTVTHGRRSEGWNWRMEWVVSTLHTTPEHGVSSITTADAHTSAANSRLNWRPHRFKWTRPFRRKTKSGFCSCAITFQTRSTAIHILDLGARTGVEGGGGGGGGGDGQRQAPEALPSGRRPCTHCTGGGMGLRAIRMDQEISPPPDIYK